MPSYQIHRLRDHLRASFRSAPHVSGAAMVKPRDYAPGDSIAAGTPYAAFFAARESGIPLEIGDLLEADGVLRICKFVGFEEAHWVLPDPKAEQETKAEPGAASSPLQNALASSLVEQE